MGGGSRQCAPLLVGRTETVNEETSVATILNLCPDFFSPEKIAGPDFFVAVAKKSLNVRQVRLATFSLVASNYARFCKSLPITQLKVWSKSHYTRFPSSNISRGVQQREVGFTLLEVMMVIGLVTVVLGATLFFDVNNYRGESFRAERSNLVVALQTARADALNNVHQIKHGVAINPNGYAGYVIYEGDSFAVSSPDTRVSIPASYHIELVSPSPSEVVFTQLSGDTAYSGELILRDPTRNATTSIFINYEGKIGW